MEDDLEDFSRWRGSVESRLGTLEAKVETEAHLRAAMDNDMATLDAKFGVQQKLIQAVAKTQSEHTALLRDHTARLTRLETGLEQVEGKLDLVHVGVQAIHTLLTGLAANPVDTDPDALPGSRGDSR